MKRTFLGVLDWFAETGTEGMIWILSEDGKSGYDSIVVLEAGDYLKVFREDDSVLFAGIIVPDYEAGKTPSPFNPEYSKPCALGFWIHWTQRGWQPDDWARLFTKDIFEQSQLRAELTKNK